MWPFDTRCTICCRCAIVTQSVSPDVFEIMGPKHFAVTTVTFQGHVMSSVTWPIDSPWANSNWLSIGTEPLSLTVFEIFSLKKPVRTQRHTPQVILYSVLCNVLHWTDNNGTRNVRVNTSQLYSVQRTTPGRIQKSKIGTLVNDGWWKQNRGWSRITWKDMAWKDTEHIIDI